MTIKHAQHAKHQKSRAESEIRSLSWQIANMADDLSAVRKERRAWQVKLNRANATIAKRVK